MAKETRVEKYKDHRKQIESTFRDANPIIEDEESRLDFGLSDEEIQKAHMEGHSLSIPIDTLIKAHDEYTIAMEKKDIERLRKENKIEERRKKVLPFLLGGILLCLIALIILIVFLLLKK